MSPAWEGLLLVDKPAGPTSHDIVARIRRITGQRRVGHAGTLDPPALGLLPLVLGRATRLVRFLPREPKHYEGSLLLGRTTTTDDVTGEVLSRHDGPLPPAAEVLAAAAGLEGRSLQVPPAVSARKVGGERLYRLARRGIAVEAPPAEIDVSCFRLEATSDPARFRFRAGVSSGTYIRALARDLGRRLDCGGTLERLVRTAIGPLNRDDAVAEPFEQERLQAGLIPPEQMPLALPPVRLAEPAEVRRFVSGMALAGVETVAGGTCRVLDGAGRLIGIGETCEGRLRPRVVIASPEPRR